MTLYYAIKYSNIGFFCYAIKEVGIILQALSISKPKYVHEMMREVDIFNIKTTDIIYKKAYLANFLVNF